jgi:hypothetical protein
VNRNCQCTEVRTHQLRTGRYSSTRETGAQFDAIGTTRLGRMRCVKTVSAELKESILPIP